MTPSLSCVDGVVVDFITHEVVVGFEYHCVTAGSDSLRLHLVCPGGEDRGDDPNPPLWLKVNVATINGSIRLVVWHAYGTAHETSRNQ